VAAIVAGAPDLRRRPKERPRLADVAVTLPKVNAVGAEALRKADAVVDDEGDIRVRTNALKRLGEPRQIMLADILHAELESRCDPGLERWPQPIREAATDLLRRNQVKLSRHRPRGRWEIDRIEIVLVHRQAKAFDVDAV